MASGILGQSAPSAATNTTVYTVPSATVATFNISVCNTSSASVTVQIAVAASGTPSTAEYLEYNAVIPPTGVLERGGIVANAAKNVVVYASAAGLAVSVYGYEA